MKKIAIIGSGISGLSAAWALRNSADVTVFETEDRIGGHSYTVDIDHGGSKIAVDVGFIVCNPLNYPNFMQFMDVLGVETQASDMSFAVSDSEGFEWSSNPSGLFAWKRNLFNPRYLKLLADILSFNKAARLTASADDIPAGQTLGDYLDTLGVDDSFRKNYILPMGAAIWSTPEAAMEAYPASSFLHFFNNHKLLHTDRPEWRTVAGGSRSYVRKIAEILGQRIRTNSAVTGIKRLAEGVEVSHLNGNETFDDVILACHGDDAKSLLGDGFENQRSVLAPISCTTNIAVLHCDESLMPRRRAAWASWNVIKGKTEQISLTYWMNRLQGIDEKKPVFVTLNPEKPPADSKTFRTFEFTHPVFDLASLRSVEALERVNGRDGLWFTGAWLGHGFHEDGLRSGLRVAMALGAEIPWQTVGINPFDRYDHGVAEQELASVGTAAE